MPGNPGKPKGAKSHVGRKLIELLEESVSEGDPKADLAALRAGSPKEKAIYWQLAGKLVPNKIDLDATGDIHINILHGAGWDKPPVDPGEVSDPEQEEVEP